MGQNFDVFPGFQKIPCVILRYTVYHMSKELSGKVYQLLCGSNSITELFPYRFTQDPWELGSLLELTLGYLSIV